MVARKQTAKWIFIAICVGLAIIAVYFVFVASASSEGGGSQLETLLLGTSLPTARTTMASSTPAP